MATTVTESTSQQAPPRSWAPNRIGDTQVELALAAAMVGAILLGVYLGRDTTFQPDEIYLFSATPHLDLRGALEPHNGHLILVPRLVFAPILHSSGADYLPIRLLGIGSVLLASGLFFVFARRRVGALAALAPTLVLLFFGSAYPHSIAGSGFAILFTQAAGISALLALDRDDRRGDVLACALLVLALATYSEGIPFVVGAAVLILLRADSRRRIWVFLVPAVLYAAWFLWSHNRAGGAEGDVSLSNLLLFPNWAFNSLATTGSSLVGLNYPQLGFGWGPVIALAALFALGLRLRQSPISRFLWATMAVLGALWLMGAAAADPPVRIPSASRYVYPTAIATLLVMAEAARGVRLQRGAIAILYAVAAISLATNIALLRDSAGVLRRVAVVYRADLTALDLDRGRLPTNPTIAMDRVLRLTGDGNVASGYLQAVREFGSPGFSLSELRAQGEQARREVDTVIANANGIMLRPTGPPKGHCADAEGTPGRGVGFKIPAGGVVIRSNGISAPLVLGRFASDFTVQAGQLDPGQWMALSVPSDSAPDPWYASTPAAPVTICRLSP